MVDNPLKCSIKERRKTLADIDGINGIDYIEVVVLGSNKCLTCRPYLVVYLFHSLAEKLSFSKDNVRIDGGIKVKNIGVEWVTKCSELKKLNPALFGKLRVDDDDVDRALIVYLYSDGDFSTYTLRIVDSVSSKNPPENFDLLLSSINFNFKIDCPAEFDCKAQNVCPPETQQEPVIDYLSKDYSSFRRLILDRMATIMPNWKERNPADFGVMMAELLSYAGDHLSYYQDAVATEAYMGTARSRISVKRHARLLDYFMHSGCNSRVWVCIQADDNLGSIIPQKTRFLTGSCNGDLVVAEEDLASELSSGAKVFEAMYDVKLYKANNDIYFYTWGDSECCLPKGATNATLTNYKDDDARKLILQKGDVLIFEETASPKGEKEDKDVSHCHAVRLINVEPTSDPLSDIPVLNIEWDDEDALPFPLCIGDQTASVAIAHGNVVLADHGLTVPMEKLVDVLGGRSFRPSLSQKSLTFKGPLDPAGSAFSAFNYDLQAVNADIYIRELKAPLANETVEITEDDWLPDNWMPKQDLLSSNKFDTDFVVENENDSTAIIRFGDDVHGMNPQLGPDDVPKLLYAFYRIGNGTEGNVGAESIKRVINNLKNNDSAKLENGKNSIRNPMPATGGVDAESIFEVRQNAPQTAKINERAIADADYAEILKQKCRDVQRAVAKTRWTGSWYTVYVTVDRFGGKEIDEEFKTQVLNTLNKYRLSGYDIEVNSPLYVPIEIEMTVNASQSSLRDEVKKALLEAFSNRTLPDGRKGFFHPDNFTFGQPVFLSKIAAAAARIDGVISLNVTKFKRTDKSDDTGLSEGVIKIGPFEIIQVENDPNYSDRGRITFSMKGGR
jgi:hypothetical protein